MHTYVPSGILIHPAVWPHGPKIGGLCPFGEELGPYVTQCGQGRGLLHTKWRLDPSNRLATIHQRYTDRQTRQDRQRSDSIGRTVLRTVAPKEMQY